MSMQRLLSFLSGGWQPRGAARDKTPVENTPSPNEHIDVGSTSPTTRVESPLFGLPPELRNMIYRYVVCEAGRIAVNRDMREPGLLATCRQVRAEAKAIWMLENDFDISVTALDVTTLILFSHYLERAGGRKVYRQARVWMKVRESYRWDRLIEWCEAVHRGRCLRYRPRSPGAGPYKLVIANALRMSRHHREQGQSWEACKTSLEMLRNVAGIADRRWLEH